MSVYRNHQRTSEEPSGFTLFELLVVILIVSLISAVAMPRMAASLPGVRLKSTTRAAAAALRYARSRAVYESRPYIAVFDNTRKLLAVKPIEDPIDVVELNNIKEIMNASEIEKVYEFPDGIEFEVLYTNDTVEDTDVFPIFFFPRGDSTGASIVLKNLRRKQYTIVVDRITGSVEIGGL